MSVQQSTPIERLLAPYIFKEDILVPRKYRDRVLVVKELLESDTSGLLNSILDYAVDSASSVDLSIETSNPNLSEILNRWLEDINIDHVGKIPTGISALSKQYYMERWKGSSFLLMRTLWENKDGFSLPTSMWFVDGEDINIEDDDSDTKSLGEESYQLKLGKNDSIDLPAKDSEEIFIQKPFEKWSTEYPSPFVIKRGLYKNAKFLELLAKKGESIVAKAIEYILLLKKGDKELVKSNNPNYTYDEGDLKAIMADLKKMVQDMRLYGGSSTYATNFDTTFEHLIPDFSMILKEELFAAAEKRMLHGFGFISVPGISGSRQEMILNPKPFQGQVYSGVNDFKAFMKDVVKMILIKNAAKKKYVNTSYIELKNGPIKQFLTADDKDIIRSFYDRGTLSKKTATDLGVDVDINGEILIRAQEKADGIDKKMSPPMTAYTDKSVDQPTGGQMIAKKKDSVPSSKKGPEKKIFKKG